MNERKFDTREGNFEPVKLPFESANKIYRDNKGNYLLHCETRKATGRGVSVSDNPRKYLLGIDVPAAHKFVYLERKILDEFGRSQVDWNWLGGLSDLPHKESRPPVQGREAYGYYRIYDPEELGLGVKLPDGLTSMQVNEVAPAAELSSREDTMLISLKDFCKSQGLAENMSNPRFLSVVSGTFGRKVSIVIENGNYSIRVPKE